MAKPIAPTPPIEGEAAVKFWQEHERMNRGEITEEEMERENKETDEMLAFFKDPEAFLKRKKK